MDGHRHSWAPALSPALAAVLVAAVAAIAGLAPMTHLVSASVAPIVHEVGRDRSDDQRRAEAEAPRTIRRRLRRRVRPAAHRLVTAVDRALAGRRSPTAPPVLAVLRM